MEDLLFAGSEEHAISLVSRKALVELIRLQEVQVKLEVRVILSEGIPRKLRDLHPNLVLVP